jgi:glutathione S-transferase
MLKIYGVPFSVHTRKVIVAAIEKKLPYDNEAVIPFSPPPGWSDLSPTGKIPVFTDGDVTLCDSSVICVYLDRTYPDAPIYPADTSGYVQTLWFEEYADGTIFRELVHGLFFNKVVRPRILKQPGDQSAIDAILTDAMPAVFGYLEKSLGEGFLVGNRLTLADIALVSNLINFHYLGYTIEKRYPKLAAYFARIIAHPSVAAALRGEQGAVAGLGLDRSFLKQLAAA